MKIQTKDGKTNKQTKTKQNNNNNSNNNNNNKKKQLILRLTIPSHFDTPSLGWA